MYTTRELKKNDYRYFINIKKSEFYQLRYTKKFIAVYNDGDFENPTSREYRLNQLSRFTQEEHWIIEGVYFSWVGSSFKHCDKIIFLSLDKDLRKINILKRLSARKDLTIEQLEKQKARLLKSNDNYDALFNKRISGFLEKFEKKIVKVDGSDFDPQKLLLSARVAPST